MVKLVAAVMATALGLSACGGSEPVTLGTPTPSGTPETRREYAARPNPMPTAPGCCVAIRTC